MPGGNTSERKRDRLRRWLGPASPNSSPTTPSNAASVSPPAVLISSPPSLSTAPTATTASGTNEPLSSGFTGSNITDSLGKKLLDQTLEKLSISERETIEKYVLSNQEDVHSVLKCILTAAETQRDLCEGKRWTFSFLGHTLQLRDEAEKVISWLDRVKTIGDVAANADPIHAGLPWAGVRLLLEAALSESRQMAALLTGLGTALYTMNRLKVYMDFLRDLPDTQARANFESSITELHSVLFKFLARGIQIFQKNLLNRAVQAFWKPDEVVNFEKDCDGIAVRVEIEAQNCDRILSKLDRQSTATSFEIFKKHLQDLREVNDSIQKINHGVEKLWIRSLEGERLEILIWTSDILYEDNHTTAKQGRLTHTSEWIFDHLKYQQWLNEDCSMILWLHGIPGAGKTKTISRIIDELFPKSTEQGFAFFYCNRNEESRREPENILRSFVKQLSIAHDGSAIHEALVESYKAKKSSGFSSARLTGPETEFLLEKLIKAYSRTTFILDALDECHESTRSALIDSFDRLVGTTKTLKILISSRRDEDLSDRLKREANVGIEATDNQDDIRKFVLTNIDDDQKKRRIPLSDDLRTLIIQNLFEKSNGMFQWAALQISQLLSLRRESDIRERLGKLPKDLTATYSEIYSTIQNQEGSRPVTADRVFQWLLAVEEPPHLELLLEAVCQDPIRENLQPVDIDVEFLLGSCQNLIIVDQNGICRFSHLSVREYFEEHHQHLQQRANKFIAEVCLLILNHQSGEDITPVDNWTFLEKTSYTSSKRALVEYAEQNWPYHLRIAMEDTIDDVLMVSTRKFLGSAEETAPAYRSWCKRTEYVFMAGGQKKLQRRMEYRERLKPPSSVLIPVCLFGLGEFLKKLCEEEVVEFGQKNEQGLSLLRLGAISGSTVVGQVLLEIGADANGPCNDRVDSPLSTAISHSNESFTLLLLEKGVDVNSELGGEYGSALAAAVYGGNESIVQLLLEKGADVNAELGGKHGSALAAAAALFGGNESIVQLLLEKGADVNAELGGKYRSALAAAVVAATGYGGKESLLLENGADVNAELGGRYGSALAAAAAVNGGNESIVQLLLEKGADVNAELGGPYGSALAAAAAETYGGNESIVQLLLEKGADVNTQRGGPYRSLLGTVASKWASGSILSLLIEKGADREYNPGYFGSVFAILAFHGRLDTLKYLSKRYSSCMLVSDSQGRNLLHFAARGSHWTTFGYLRSLGLDLIAKDAREDTILHHAAAGGNVRHVSELFGVDFMELSKSLFWSPLHWACRAGSADAVRVLLAKGVRSNEVKTTSSPERTWSPYSIAVYHNTWRRISATDGFEGIDESKLKLDMENEETLTAQGKKHVGFWCDGCFHDIRGPRFHCGECENFNYCFMCQLASEKTHPGHEFECIEALDEFSDRESDRESDGGF